MVSLTKWKETVIGKIPEDWDLKNAEDFCTRVTDGTHDSPKKREKGKHLITSKHLKNGHLDFDNSYLISAEDFIKVNRRSKVDQWDVILSMIGTLGNVYLERSSKIDYAIKNVGLFKTGSETKGKWLYFYFQSKDAKNYISASRGGTTQEYITLEALRKFPIPFPQTTREVELIIGILDSLDQKIELNNQMNKTLENIAQAIFKRWFIDFEFPNENGEPYKSSGGEMVESELGMIPKGWQITSIKNLGDVICGKTPSTKVKENFGLDIPFITIPDMRGNTFVVKTERLLSHIGMNSQRNKLIPPFSICVSCIATPGLVSITSEYSQTNQQINSIVCHQGDHVYFVYLSMKNKSEEIRKMGLGGSATLNLNTNDFGNIKIVLPDQ